MSIHCSSCGVPLESGTTSCPNCGEPVVPETPGPSVPGEPLLSDASSHRPSRRSGSSTFYYVLGLGFVALVTVIFILSNPEHVKGPPQGTTSADGMPHGHPPTDGSGAMTPEQKAEMERARKEVEKRAGEVREALDADKGNDSLRLVLANYYYDLGRYAEAIPLYRACLEKKPRDANIRTDLAFCMANLEDVDGAISELRIAIDADPRHQNAPYTLAMMYVAKRNQDSTMYWLRKVIAIDSTTQQAQNASMIVAKMAEAHSSGSATTQ